MTKSMEVALEAKKTAEQMQEGFVHLALLVIKIAEAINLDKSIIDMSEEDQKDVELLIRDLRLRMEVYDKESEESGGTKVVEEETKELCDVKLWQGHVPCCLIKGHDGDHQYPKRS